MSGLKYNFKLMQNEIESKMDEVEDDSAAKFGNPEETTFEERRFIPKEVLDATNTGDSGNCEILLV